MKLSEIAKQYRDGAWAAAAVAENRLQAAAIACTEDPRTQRDLRAAAGVYAVAYGLAQRASRISERAEARELRQHPPAASVEKAEFAAALALARVEKARSEFYAVLADHAGIQAAYDAMNTADDELTFAVDALRDAVNTAAKNDATLRGGVGASKAAVIQRSTTYQVCGDISFALKALGSMAATEELRPLIEGVVTFKASGIAALLKAEPNAPFETAGSTMQVSVTPAKLVKALEARA